MNRKQTAAVLFLAFILPMAANSLAAGTKLQPSAAAGGATDDNAELTWKPEKASVIQSSPAGSTPPALYIADDPTGGNCISAGHWDYTTKTCTLTSDVYRTVEIESDGIILDGGGHAVLGQGNGFGIYLSDVHRVTLKNIEIRNFSDGIYIIGSNDNSIRGISSTANYNGLSTYFSTNNRIKDSTFSGNHSGIVLGSADDNSISRTTFSNNVNGIEFFMANNNEIYNNNFLKNSMHVTSMMSTNVFTKAWPIGGNFWCDCAQKDIDGDGIVDSPYELQYATDLLPWSIANGWDPGITEVMHGSGAVPVNTLFTLTTVADDSNRGDTIITSVEFKFGANDWTEMSPVDGQYDSVAEQASIEISFPEQDIHDICFRATDALGNTSQPACAAIAVYDPAVGSLRGKGTTYASAGDFRLEPEAAGYIYFKLHAAYKKDEKTPRGKIAIKFPAARINFRSISLDWLIVSDDSYARIQGTGTINNQGPYRFEIHADTGSPNLLWISIWNENNEGDVESVLFENSFLENVDSGRIVILDQH